MLHVCVICARMFQDIMKISFFFLTPVVKSLPSSYFVLRTFCLVTGNVCYLFLHQLIYQSIFFYILPHFSYNGFFELQATSFIYAIKYIFCNYVLFTLFYWDFECNYYEADKTKNHIMLTRSRLWLMCFELHIFSKLRTASKDFRIMNAVFSTQILPSKFYSRSIFFIWNYLFYLFTYQQSYTGFCKIY